MKRMAALLLLLLISFSCVTAEEHPRCWVQDINNDYSPETYALFKEYGSFTPMNSYSFDSKYMALQSVERREDDASKRVYVYIFNTESSEVVDVLRSERAFNFWGISWSRDNYDIYVQSADVGIYTFRYIDGSWIRDLESQVPEYIVTRWDIVDTTHLCESLIGRTLTEIYNEYPVHICYGSMGYLKSEKGYIVIGSDWVKVEHAVGFSTEGDLLCSINTVPLSSALFNATGCPTTFSELQAAFGQCNADPLSGRMVWVYYLDDGHIASFDIYGDNLEFLGAKTITEVFDEYEQSGYFDGLSE